MGDGPSIFSMPVSFGFSALVPWVGIFVSLAFSVGAMDWLCRNIRLIGILRGCCWVSLTVEFIDKLICLMFGWEGNTEHCFIRIMMLFALVIYPPGNGGVGWLVYIMSGWIASAQKTGDLRNLWIGRRGKTASLRMECESSRKR